MTDTRPLVCSLPESAVALTVTYPTGPRSTFICTITRKDAPHA